MSSIGTFDFRKVKVLLGGKELTGFAPGDCINWKERDKGFKMIVGADGWVDRFKNNSNALIITITLMQTSGTHEILSGLYFADKSGNFPLPIIIQDGGASPITLVTATEAWITGAPDYTYSGSETKPIVWEINTGSQYGWFVSGNK